MKSCNIVSSDNQILGKYYFRDNRTPIFFNELPKNLVEALISTEDERFYEHSGIDWKSTLRAFVYLGKKGGASTITQQLARQLFVGVRSRNIFEAIGQKIKEWVISVQLERTYNKNEIMKTKIIAIIQARMGSKRLPGKVLKEYKNENYIS